MSSQEFFASVAALNILSGSTPRHMRSFGPRERSAAASSPRRELTDADRQRILAAELKRARKNARRLAQQAKNGGAK